MNSLKGEFFVGIGSDFFLFQVGELEFQNEIQGNWEVCQVV